MAWGPQVARLKLFGVTIRQQQQQNLLFHTPILPCQIRPIDVFSAQIAYSCHIKLHNLSLPTIILTSCCEVWFARKLALNLHEDIINSYMSISHPFFSVMSHYFLTLTYQIKISKRLPVLHVGYCSIPLIKFNSSYHIKLTFNLCIVFRVKVMYLQKVIDLLITFLGDPLGKGHPVNSCLDPQFLPRIASGHIRHTVGFMLMCTQLHNKQWTQQCSVLEIFV